MMPVASQVQVRRVFLSAMGIVYVIAFASLCPQLDGLIGHAGILPAQEFLDALTGRMGNAAWARVPTIAWLTGASDSALHLLCLFGVSSGLALTLGVAPVANALGAWIAYLSLYSLGRDFLSFQWDILLLEAGFLAIFYAPRTALWWGSPAWGHQPTRPLTWVLRLLIAKLMFLSGVVKLTSGDPTWWNLTALSYHYETTCLPTWTGWYAHQLPMWFHQLSAAGMFVVELAVPVLIFAGRRGRVLTAVAFSGLMLFIAATGNYGFFNLLALALCVPLLDDGHLPGWLGSTAPRTPRAADPLAASIDVSAAAHWILAATVLLLTVIPVGRALRLAVAWPAALVRLYELQAPFHIVNGYGLFARMTTQRAEIILEGSDDGLEWRAYEFRWKPGDINRRPRIVQPHMPRLDWQMWFAALGTYQTNPWYVALCQRLLQGSEPVLDLLAFNPFPQHPPRYLRSILYEYRFTRRGDDNPRAAWWQRAVQRNYMPTLALAEDGSGSLRVASELE